LSAGVLYTATETPQTGYAASAWGGDCSAGGTITLAPGDDKTCTITNDDQPGKIIVKKETIPGGASQSFEFDPSYSASNFSLTDGQQNDSGDLAAGTYSVAEVNIAVGWLLTDSGCSDGSLVSAISLQNGETVTCTFVNTGP
jgi:hypothetical protein